VKPSLEDLIDDMPRELMDAMDAEIKAATAAVCPDEARRKQIYPLQRAACMSVNLNAQLAGIDGETIIEAQELRVLVLEVALAASQVMLRQMKDMQAAADRSAEGQKP
jgi:hypothetical protein